LDIERLYLRQRELGLTPPKSVAVIGLGGGSWVGYFCALVGVQKIVLVDYDIIEVHNLNRTPYRKVHIGSLKVKALAEILYEIRPNITVIPIPKRIEEVTDVEKEFFKDVEIVFDCRDRKDPLPNFLQGKKIIALGCDGFEGLIHYNPDYSKLWGEAEGYTVPQFYATPVLLSALAVLSVCLGKTPESEKVIQYDVRNLLFL